MNRKLVRRWFFRILGIVILLLMIVYIVDQEPSFEHVMEVFRTFGELYLWPIVVLVLIGWIFREPISRLIGRIRSFSTPIGPIELLYDELAPAPEVEGQLDRNHPGNIYWLAHNLQHTQLRLEFLWPTSEVVGMLDRSIHHARHAKVPSEIISRLENVRQRVINTPPNKALWHGNAQELEEISRTIAKVAENSHPKGDEYVLPPG